MSFFLREIALPRNSFPGDVLNLNSETEEQEQTEPTETEADRLFTPGNLFPARPVPISSFSVSSVTSCEINSEVQVESVWQIPIRRVAGVEFPALFAMIAA